MIEQIGGSVVPSPEVEVVRILKNRGTENSKTKELEVVSSDYTGTLGQVLNAQ